MPEDAMQIRVRVGQDLLQPVLQLDIRIAAQLAEHRGTLDCLICQAVELAKQRDTTDFTHFA